MRALIRVYMDYTRAMNFSDETVQQRESFLHAFADWCALRGLTEATDITKPILERYRRHLHHSRDRNGKPMGHYGQYTRLVALRQFFKWLTQQNYLLYNPASELMLPKKPKALPKNPLNEKEMEIVLAQADVTTFEGLRDRAIMETFYSTGIRRAELIKLLRCDIDRPRGAVSIRAGKGLKDRFTPIGERAITWVDRYLHEVRPYFVIEPDPENLFLEHTGQPLDRDRLSRRMMNYIKDADVGKSGGCHLFRHTAATLMMEHGADIRMIQAFLGHSDLSTTQIYTHVSIHKLKDIHTATHPGGGKTQREGRTHVLDDEDVQDILSQDAHDDE